MVRLLRKCWLLPSKLANKASAMKAVWLSLGRGLDRLGDYFLIAAATMLLLMLALLGVEIFDRAVLKSSTQIADEYSGYLFTWATMLCFLYAQRSGRLLRVEVLRNRMSPKGKACADSAADLLAAVLCGVLVYATWATFRGSLQFGSVSIQPSQTPLAYPQIMMPVGLGILGLSFLHSGLSLAMQGLGFLPISEKAAPAQVQYE